MLITWQILRICILIAKLETENIIRICTPSFLTPIDKITVIKSLLLSKITPVLLSPPTPTKSLMEEIDQMFKDFLWGKKSQKSAMPIWYLHFPNVS